jgi:hypothetical protein
MQRPGGMPTQTGCCHSVWTQRTHGLGRRVVLDLLGSAALLAGLRPSLTLAAGGTEALLLKCIDYRLIDAAEQYMVRRGMAGKYDELELAGASLGAKNDKNPAWGTTFWDHVQLSLDLHHIHKIVIMDHRDCGEYKIIFGRDLAADPKEELAVHAGQMRSLKADIGKKYPSFEVEMLLMALDGKVETIT